MKDKKIITTNTFRLAKIKDGLEIIKQFDKPITSSKDLDGISGIGKGIKSRIDEILETGLLAELEGSQIIPLVDAIKSLQKVIGIGPNIAKDLVINHQIRNVAELKKAVRNKSVEVSQAIMLGLKYYDLLDEKIPHATITKIKNYLEKELSSIDRHLEMVICGSYRRGKATSGDIDLLIYHPQYMTKDDTAASTFLSDFVNVLDQKKFIIDHLTFQNYTTKYMGFCQFEKRIMRIDIRFIPYQSLSAAMLYFTGPYQLNRVMRSKAKNLDLKLNEYGIYRDDQLIPTHSEAEIFEILGMKYLPPEKREVYNTGVKMKKIN